MATELPTEALAALAQANGSVDEPHLAYVGDDDDGVVKPPTAPAPLDNIVTLPGGGLLDIVHGTVENTAEVRELDGEDEEAIIRVAGNLAKMLDTILARGVVSVGGQKADRKVLDRLLIGDRDALLVAIRRVTFGNEMLFNGRCLNRDCAEEQEITVDLATDIPQVEFSDPFGDRAFDHECATGKSVHVTLPDGSVHRALADVQERNEAVLNSILLSRCVDKVNGQPVLDAGSLKKTLTMRERAEIIKEITERNPGPRLTEVKRPCSSCGEDIPVPLSLVSLFLV